MNKKCPICRATIEETAVVCPFCGGMQSTEVSWSDPAWTGGRGGRTYPSSTAKGLTIALAVFCFLTAASMLSILLLLSDIDQLMRELDLFDEYVELLSELSIHLLPTVVILSVSAVFYVTFGVLLLVKKDWKIALTITIYSAALFLLKAISAASAGIPLVLVFGILSTIWLKKDSVPPL